jgi:hypothetical protein
MTVKVEPVVVKAGSGWRWLAVAPQGSFCRFAVIGNSEDEARARFQESASTWKSLLASDTG